MHGRAFSVKHTEVVLSGNVKKKEVQELLKKSKSFEKEMGETFFEHTLTSEKQFIASHLCYNSLIRIDNKPLFSQRLVPEYQSEACPARLPSKFLRHDLGNYES